MTVMVTKNEIYWPAAVILVALLAANVLILLLTTGEDRIMALAVVDSLGLTILAFMRQLWKVGPVIGIVMAGGFALAACAGVSHQTRLAYALEQARCVANQQEIVNRPDTTYQEDLDALEDEIVRCDTALHAIEVADGEGE